MERRDLVSCAIRFCKSFPRGSRRRGCRGEVGGSLDYPCTGGEDVGGGGGRAQLISILNFLIKECFANLGRSFNCPRKHCSWLFTPAQVMVRIVSINLQSFGYFGNSFIDYVTDFPSANTQLHCLMSELTSCVFCCQ